MVDAIAYAGNLHAGQATDPLMSAMEAGILLGFLFQVAGFATMGFLVATIARSPGTCMRITQSYMAILEQVVQRIVTRFRKRFAIFP